MTVSEYIFDFLEKKGVKNVFMVSGSSAMWLTDALKRNDRLTLIAAIMSRRQPCPRIAVDVSAMFRGYVL